MGKEQRLLTAIGKVCRVGWKRKVW